MKRAVVILFLLIPSICLAQAWPKKGTNFTKGCEALTKALEPLFKDMTSEAQKHGEKFQITARLCISGDLHIRATFIMRENQKLFETDMWVTYAFRGVETNDKGQRIVDVSPQGMKLVSVTEFPTESAEQEKKPKAEKF